MLRSFIPGQGLRWTLGAKIRLAILLIGAVVSLVLWMLYGG